MEVSPLHGDSGEKNLKTKLFLLTIINWFPGVNNLEFNQTEHQEAFLVVTSVSASFVSLYNQIMLALYVYIVYILYGITCIFIFARSVLSFCLVWKSCLSLNISHINQAG